MPVLSAARITILLRRFRRRNEELLSFQWDY
jgi:hypothetical protein